MNFLELVKARYSVRNYEERPIEQNKLDYIMECVRLAPSAVNFQPWKFAVITEKKLLEALKSAYPREWIKTAPCIIVACGDHNVAWHRKLDNKDHTDVDVSIAVEHLCLAAAEQGLGTCWVCNFDVPLCKGDIGIACKHRAGSPCSGRISCLAEGSGEEPQAFTGYFILINLHYLIADIYEM